MTGHFTQRVVTTVPVIIGVTLLTFLLMRAAAGSIVPGLGDASQLTAEDIERLRRNLGLDRPILLQYLSWLGDLIRGDLGVSMIDGRRISALILDRLPNTLVLTSLALVLGGSVAVLLGVLAARHRGKTVDRLIVAMSVVGFSVPQFWLGLVLVLLFAIQFRSWGLPALPSSGAVGAVAGGDLLDRLAHLVLPVGVLAFFYLCVWSRFMRSSMLEVLSQEYMVTARAKGLSERRAIYSHALRNALLPLITIVGLELPGLVSGSLLVEVVFSWPGIGSLTYQRALQYDFTTVMGLTTVAAIMVVFGNLLADVLYGIVDPRIRAA
jgi:peptide/nickel transport system permease protein